MAATAAGRGENRLASGFPIPAKFRLGPQSRITEGQTWPAAEDATRTKQLRIYRYNPDSGENPGIDTYEIDLDRYGPVVLDALIGIKNTIDPTLTFRRSCREGVCGSCAMNIDGSNWLACTRVLEETRDPLTVYPLNNLPVVKDLVPDQTHLLGQHTAIKPWLRTQTPTPPDRERLQSPEDRAKLDGLYECILCFCCTSGCPSGGTETAISALRCTSKPTAGLWTAATRPPVNA